ncbi:MAG TPA: PEP-CTERM sorting domain-containing protein [Tepidisphaeraceae bacterium]|nr:PEP-CTERM sorting domain-containing protein [Tepidisphaeraceae bacterium]
MTAIRRPARAPLAAGIVAAVLAWAPPAQAALVLTDLTTRTESFDTFDGTAATVPTDFTAGGLFTFGSPGRVLTSGTSPYNSTPGWYALNDNGSTSDVAFGARTNATNGSGTLTWAVTNGTGQPLTGLQLVFDVERYSTSGSGNRIDVTWSPDNVTYGTAGLAGDTQTTIGSGGTADTVLADPVIIADRAVALTQTIADGETVYLRFFWNPVSGGARPHFGIDNLELTAVVPEPGSLALAGGAAVALLVRRGRRRRA